MTFLACQNCQVKGNLKVIVGSDPKGVKSPRKSKAEKKD
jgi:hypothetical protein